MKKKSKLKIKSLPRFISYCVTVLVVLALVVTTTSFAISHVVSASKKQPFQASLDSYLVASLEKVVRIEAAGQSQQINGSLQDKTTQELKDRLRANDTEGLKVVFLTLDDGPSTHTGEVLDIFKVYDVKATFFTNHKQGPEAQDSYRRILAEGHTLANHTSSHRYEIYNDVNTFMADVNSLAAYHKELTGVDSPKIFRFPGGSTNSNQACIDAILAAGYNYADWNVIAGDGITDVPPPDVIAQNIIDGCHNFDVSTVLFHAELKENSRLALPIVIENLKNEGYTFLAMEEDFVYPRHWD